MPLIMGIGDEVIHFLVGLLVMVVAAFAWWSTNARPDRYRAVILRPYRYNNDTLTTVRSGDRPVSVRYANDNTIDTGRTGTGALAVESPHTIDSDGDLVPLQEMDSIVDAHMALLDNNRLHFYRRVQYAPPRMVHITVTDAPFISDIERSDPEPPSNAQIREMDSIVSAMEADETACDVFTRPQGNESNSSSQATSEKENEDKEPESNSDESNAEAAEVTSEEASERKILIRLKYLNDTLKEVEGRLDELLKDFKWRHFSSELSASSRVRLIFNGRVLCDEAATLQALGLHHRAVVHCLVHPRRNTPQRGGASSGNGTVGAAAEEPAPLGGLDAAPGPRAAPERAWDLENILMTLVSVALTVVWFFRCEYSNMFTASASVALFGLTVFYSVAIFGLYLSDTFHFERRPPRVPNN